MTDKLKSLPQVIKIADKDIKKNRKTNDKQSAENIIIIVHYLALVITGLRKELGRVPFRDEIIYEMKRIGFEISEQTLIRYRGKIASVRTAVRDLLEEGTYSAYFDHNMSLLADIEEYAIQCYLKTWTGNKTVHRQVNDKDAGIVDLEDNHVTTELPAGKAAFLKILTIVVDLRNKALSGDNVNLSAALLSENFQKLKEDYEELGRKHIITERELKTVLKKKGKDNATSTD